MSRILMNQVGFLPGSKKKAVLDFEASDFKITDDKGNNVFDGKTKHFGTDDISGEDTYVADFSELTKDGKYRVVCNDVTGPLFTIGDKAYDKLKKDICKCFYFLRCGDALDKKYAGVYYHEPCHLTKATVYGEDTEPVDVSGGWHDAGDYGRYSTAGAVAVAHILYGVRFFKNLLDIEFDIPKVKCDDGFLPDLLAETKVELDFLMKMQRENGSVWHKVTTFNHAGFVMPEDDKNELFLFSVSSMATADVAAVFALGYTVYKEYDRKYAGVLLARALKAYKWLSDNPKELLFKNAEGSNTGEYGESEDISNRFWAACALYDATGEESYIKDAIELRGKLTDFDREAKKKGYNGNVFTCLGWAEVAGLGGLSLILKNEENDLTAFAKEKFVREAERLCAVAAKNGFDLCMEKADFIWGSNMELLKYLMVLTVANIISPDKKYANTVTSGIDYLLGCNSMDVSYVTGNGEKAFKNPHLRPTAVDNIEEPWPGLVSGGPNRGLQDERARELPKDLPPMKCYLDDVACYSLNEITIYWNSPLVFVLGALLAK